MCNAVRYFFLACAVMCVVAPLAAEAVVLRTGEDVVVTNEQVVADDFYAAGTVVTSSGDIEGDFYAAANSFTNNGTIDGDVVVLASTVQLHASVTDDVRVVGGEVKVAGPIGGDVVVLGGSLEILSTASVAGDILFYGGELKVLGAVEGSVLGAADTVRIDASVGDAIDMDVQSLTLGDRAEIFGNVDYVSHHDLVRSQNAVVVGEIQKRAPVVDTDTSYDNFLVSFVIILFTALIVQLVFRQQLTRLLDVCYTHLGVSGLVGLGTVVVAPLVIILAFVSMLGFLVGLILFVSLLGLTLLSMALMSVVLGGLIAKYTQDISEPHVLYTIVGAAIIQALTLADEVGMVVIFIFFFITLGGIVLALFKHLRA